VKFFAKRTVARARNGARSVWDAGTGELKQALMGNDEIVGLSRDGGIIARVDHDLVKLWDVPTGKLVSAVDNKGSGRFVAFSSDGRFLAATSTVETTGEKVIKI
jgi:WD40 repeat protein